MLVHNLVRSILFNSYKVVSLVFIFFLPNFVYVLPIVALFICVCVPIHFLVQASLMMLGILILRYEMQV